MSLYQRIIVPVDDSLAAHHGLRTAIALARDQSALLKLFTVVDEATGDYGGGELGWVGQEGLDERLRTDAQLLLAEAVTHAESAGLTPESELIEAPRGHVAQTIHRAASEWHADLLVIGTHGRHGLAHMLFGSMTEDLVRSPEQQILVVPTKRPAEAEE